MMSNVVRSQLCATCHKLGAVGPYLPRVACAHCGTATMVEIPTVWWGNNPRRLTRDVPAISTAKWQEASALLSGEGPIAAFERPTGVFFVRRAGA